MSEFPAYGKTPRLFRDAIYTEKIDGTNGLISIEDVTEEYRLDGIGGLSFSYVNGCNFVDTTDDRTLRVRAGSRNRWLDPVNGEDNYGFGAWVQRNADKLADLLGPGNHYGEWWGHGIQRGYQMTHKTFSLFNVDRWDDIEYRAAEAGWSDRDTIATVPVLARRTFDTEYANELLRMLAKHGSYCGPGWNQAEGIVVFHSASRQVFKALIENDHLSKTEADAA